MLKSSVWRKYRYVLRYVELFPEVEVIKPNKMAICSLERDLKPGTVPKRLYMTTCLNNKIRLLNAYTTVLESRRLKSQKKKNQEDSDESEGEEDYSLDDNLELGKDFKEITVSSASLRIDAVLKAGLGIARHKAEEAVYNSRVRLNGEKVFKKGTKVNIGDELDLIKNVNAKNEDFLDISRLTVKNVMEKSSSGKNLLILHRFKAMTIENYPNPWKMHEE